MQLLAQGKIDDWFELAVIAVVVIGTAVANLVKWLAAKKQEREAARQAGSPFPQARAPREIRAEPQELTPEEQMRVPPIAPPIPDLRPETQSELERLRRRARERQAGEQFVPPPPTMPRQRVPGKVEEARRLAEQLRRAAAEESRRAAEEAARRNEQRRRERTEKERRERTDNERRDPAKRERREAAERAAKAQRLSQGSESMDQRQARLAQQRDARLGHVGEGVVPSESEHEVQLPAAVEAARAAGAVRRIPTLTRHSLRDAIVLREILSPPLSIRSDDDLGL